MEIIKNTLASLFYSLLLFADSKPTLQEKAFYGFKLFIFSAPVLYVLEIFDVWFNDNHQFVTFVIFCLAINMCVGAWFHFKQKTFSWSEFFKRNSEMFVVLIIVYFLLEMINQIAGKTLTGEYFTMSIQILTLLYPISKTLKNVHILTNYKHPPSFIMDRIYKFEKEGNVKDLFKKD